MSRDNSKFIKHGMCGTPEYRAYHAIKNRCYKENLPGYEHYGNRGIRVCDRWLESFENFYKDMGQRPSGKYSIHRIDNDGDYEPNNCKWATTKEQSLERRNSRKIEYDGKILNLSEWAKLLDIDPNTIVHRLNHGWSIEKTLTHPLIDTNVKIEYKGQTLTRKQWSEKTGLPDWVIRKRIKNGWSLDRVLNEPLNEKYSNKNARGQMLS